MRFLHLLSSDMRFQLRYGFYYLYFIFTIFYSILLYILPSSWQLKAATIMIYSDPSALGLLFMGAIILLEKSERVLQALVVSPVQIHEYIASKILSLAFISTLVSCILGFLANLPIGFVCISTILTSTIFTLLGILIATKINTLNQYLCISIPIQILALLPPLISLFLPGIWQYFPLNSSLYLLQGTSSNFLLDTSILILIILFLYVLTIHTTKTMWKSLGAISL